MEPIRLTLLLRSAPFVKFACDHNLVRRSGHAVLGSRAVLGKGGGRRQDARLQREGLVSSRTKLVQPRQTSRPLQTHRVKRASVEAQSLQDGRRHLPRLNRGRLHYSGP